MIAPEVREGSNGESGRRLLLRCNLFVAALIFFALEFWRPYFFLTDDNLDGGLPFFTEMGRHLLAGQSPYVSDYLFGGHYDLLRDPTFFAWHPLYLLASLLAGTPWRLAIIDVSAFGLFMLTVAGFVNLAWYLRRELQLTVSNGWIMFYTLGFVYSMIAITTGASWMNFLGSQSALPWLALGILQRKWRPSLGLIALFSVHQILGSHLEPTISNALFLSLFALGAGWARRSWQPVLCWGGGYLIAVLVLLPFLVPLVGGFLSSARAHGVDLVNMGRNNIPFRFFPTSIFFGMAIWIIKGPVDYNTTYTLALGASAAPWCILALGGGRTKWSRLELLVAAMVVIVGVMVCRPRWISQIMIHLPLLKAMRWPFREMIQFQFFFYLLLLIRKPGWMPRTRTRLAIFSTCIYVIPMLAYKPSPTFNRMEVDRHLLRSGGFESYWSHVRPLFKPGDRLIVILPWKVYDDDRFDLPYSLLSTYNYSCLSHVVNVWGYSNTVPADQVDFPTYAYYPFGSYRPEQKAKLMTEAPHLKFITIESLQPLRITLSSRDGPTIDLTPFIPPEVRAWPIPPPSKDKPVE